MKLTIPKTLGACVDKILALRDSRAKLEKQAEDIKSQETMLKEHVLNSFNKSDVEGAKGKAAVASIQRKTVARVNDWDKFYGYIAKEKAWDMLQRRPNDAAYNARLNNEEQVPGVEPFVVVTLSVRKAGAK